MRKTKNTFKDLVSENLGSSRTRREVSQQLGLSGPIQIGALPSGSLSVDSAQSSGLAQSLLASTGGSAGSQVSGQVAQLSTALNDLKAAQQAQLDSLTQNTQALTQNTSSSSGGSSALSTVGSVASSILGGGLGLSSIVTGLMSLFGGGGSSAPTAPTPFSLPSAIQYEGGYNASTGQVSPVDYGESGTLRTVGSSATTTQPQASTVQISINALDSQSFLDHSDDIAQAVRQAMLGSSSLNDVIAGL